MPPTKAANGLGASPGSSPYPSSRPGSSKPSTPSNSASGHSSLILRKQLMGKSCLCSTLTQSSDHSLDGAELQKNPVDGFSAGLVDDDNILEWQIVIMGPADTLYEGGILKSRLIFPPEFPLLPPKMIFDTEMWHPNIYNKGDKKGEVCVSILHQPGDDVWGYEDAGERWLPVHTVESVLISVISLLSADVPDLNSPANVDAAKEVRENFAEYKKKVRRLVRRSAEEAYD